MQDIDSVIKAKRQSLQRLQEEIDVLERAKTLLDGGQVPSAEPETRARLVSGKRLAGPEAKGHFSPGSQVGRTIAILRDAGVALHITEIMRRIEQQGGGVSKASLVGSLARLVKEERVFFRKAPGTFALMEWKNPTVAALPLRPPVARNADLPPGNHGTDSKSVTGWPGRQ